MTHRLLTILLAAVLALAGSAGARSAPTVAVFPSSQTIGATPLPPGGAGAVSLNAAAGEREGAWIVVTGAGQVAATVDVAALGGLGAEIAWGHYVRFDAGERPDALLPWKGEARPAERPNQPLYLRVIVPEGASPGVHRTTVTVTADGVATAVPVAVTVFPVRLPSPATAPGNLLTSFHVVPETYVKKVSELYRLPNNAARSAANLSLFTFLAAYRISPASWGFGEPGSRTGYAPSRKWWLDSAGNMAAQGSAGGGFSAMRIPISSNRASTRNLVAGISPAQPQTWCKYLSSVRSFWASRGWLDRRRVPYLFTFDEPGLEGMRLVARQAAAAHACFPRSKMLVTANPTAANRFAWDGKGGNDADIWAVLSRRYYGEFTNPKATVKRTRENLALVNGARKTGKWIWSSTYTAVAGSPGYAANEPLSDPRVFLLWNALEGIGGTLYADGVTTYTNGNPFDAVARNGVDVLIYPGGAAPVPSARIEQIRDGIEDWALLNIVRAKYGAARVRALLGRAGLFSANAAGVRLACHLGCELKSATKYSWPLWSHDASTARRIEITRLEALRLASSDE